MPFHYDIAGARIKLSTIADGNMSVRGKRRTWGTKMDFFRRNFLGNGESFGLVSICPVHGSEIKVVDRNSGGIVNGHDALISRDPQVVLAADWADCYPVAVWDVKTKLKAVIHAGFKGAALEIVFLTIREMISLGAKTEDLYAFIGPGICSDCYDYGPEALEMAGEKYSQYLRWDVVRERYFIDIVGIIHQQLFQCDIVPDKVTDVTTCTFESQWAFSARRQQPLCIDALQAGVMMIGLND